MSDDARVERVLDELIGDLATSPARRAVTHELVARFADLVREDPDDDDLKVAASILDELLDAANVFSPWRDRRKLTVFGSARTPASSPLYEMARELGRRMTERGWITVSGAGPGIMEAAARGAGLENTLGVNVDLPFEQSANPFVDAETRLVETKYFFTRKVALTRESLAFAIFPGGLGTLDETFEILTLLHTGKSSPAPVVLVDVAGGTYWERWQAFVEEAIIADGYLDAPDVCLYRIVHDLEGVIAEIDRFYSNFISFDLAGGRATVALQRPPTPAQLADLVEAVPAFAAGEGYRATDLGISFAFDGRQYVSLRRVIDVANGWVAAGA